MVAVDAVKQVWVESGMAVMEVVSEGDVAEDAVNADAERGLGEIMAGSASSSIVNLVSHGSMRDWHKLGEHRITSVDASYASVASG